jgi:hypothetical protein
MFPSFPINRTHFKHLSIVIISSLLFSCRGAAYDVKVQFGVNTDTKDPTAITRFDTKEIESKTFFENKSLHFILNFYVDEALLESPIKVTLSIPHNETLLVFFQFGVHTPLMRVEGERKMFDFSFMANENQAYVFSLLPLAPMVIDLSLMSLHRMVDLNQGKLPNLTIVEATPR